MKKLILLFTMVCAASQLYGMEPTEKKEALRMYTSPEMLPELRKKIINAALRSSDNLKEAITTIEKFSILHRVELNNLFNLKDFTKLVHMLADKFDLTTQAVAVKFGTATERRYLDLVYKLKQAIRYHPADAKKIAQLIEQGADVNSTDLYSHTSILIEAVKEGANAQAQIIKLLLDAGANPHHKDIPSVLGDGNKTALDYAREKGASQEVIELLQDAMKK